MQLGDGRVVNDGDADLASGIPASRRIARTAWRMRRRSIGSVFWRLVMWMAIVTMKGGSCEAASGGSRSLNHLISHHLIPHRPHAVLCSGYLIRP